MMHTNSACRACGGARLERFLSLGPTPLANAFLNRERLAEPEPTFPLDVYLCGDCSLVQLRDVVSPELLFKDYVYVSSTSESFVAHFRSFAEDAVDRFGLERGSLVVDVGSNDGILLRPFQELGMRVLGVDPAENVARLATRAGIETLPVFFDEGIAREIVRTRGPAKVVTGTNVFAHVDRPQRFMAAARELLSDDGVFIAEFPYLADLFEKNLFDTVYHEHLSYFSVKPLTMLFPRMGFEIVELRRVPTHGGSLRVFARKTPTAAAAGPSVEELLLLERELGLGELRTWLEFAERVRRNKEALRSLLEGLKTRGKRIAGYGAPAKGNTLLNYFQLGPEQLDYIVEDSAFKQGLYTPGTRIPVVAPDRLRKDRPDFILLLAWNFAGPIMEKLSSFKREGGRFILPVPEPKVV